MNTKTYNQLLLEMKNKAIAALSGVSDFNQGSIIMTIFESVARPMEQAYIDTRNGYANNLRAIPYSVFGFEQKKGERAGVKVVFTRNAGLPTVSTIPTGTRVSNGSLVFTTTEPGIIEAGTKATVNLVFTRSEATSSESIIPVGTIVNNGNVNFITTESGVIESGETQSADIPAQAESIGVEYNVAANTITTIGSSLPEEITNVTNPEAAAGGTDGATQSNSISASAENVGLEYNVAADTITTIESSLTSEIVSVTNPDKATGGTDAETQTQMLRRFKTYINGLQGSNRYGIESGLLGLEGVRSVGIEEHFPPENGIYNMTIYVDDGTGRLPEDLKNKCIDVVNGDDTEENPGLRAAGVNVKFLPATPVYVDVKVTVTIYRVESERVENDITTKLQEYINGLGIHENVVLSSMIVLLKQVSGVTDVSGLMLKTGDEWVADNINIGVNMIARFNSVDITIVQG